MMNDKNDVIQILGALMKKPGLLSKTDKYSLDVTDFSTRFEKCVFDAIYNLYFKGAQRITVIDIENYLESNDVAKLLYEKNNGREFLEDAEEFSQENNFDYYYEHFKKINALQDLKKLGFDTSDFYCKDLTDPKSIEINQRFEKIEIGEIFDEVKKKILKVEQKFLKNDVSESSDAFEGLEEVLRKAKSREDIGLPLQGIIINEIMSGARKGTFCLRSGASGLGKTRTMIADACFLAFPFRFDWYTGKWEQKGNSRKVCYIATEQDKEEIQRMILAYVTGMNESKFKYGVFTDLEEKVILQAMGIIKLYRDNLQIVKIPNPTNELIKTVIRENVVLYNIEYVFYDYIFIGPALLREFKGFSLRSDELLLILSTTLKDLASELNIFVMSATQVSAKADENKDIRNEGSLAGGRATINKADYGFIMARPTKEELDILRPFLTKYGREPNLVTDVFKVRAGQWSQIRIWSVFDAGILIKEDLFATDSRLEIVEIPNNFAINWETSNYEELYKLKEELNEGVVPG